MLKFSEVFHPQKCERFFSTCGGNWLELGKVFHLRGKISFHFQKVVENWKKKTKLSESICGNQQTFDRFCCSSVNFGAIMEASSQEPDELSHFRIPTKS